MSEIEHKELKGITLKLLWVIVAGTAVGVFTAAGAYFGIKEQISSHWAVEQYWHGIDSVKRSQDESDIYALKQDVNQLKSSYTNSKNTFRNEKDTAIFGHRGLPARFVWISPQD